MKELQKGQMLLVVILVMTVVLTVGLSVATRAITNTRIANEEESSKRAFSAAEAGLERSLQSGSNTNGTFTNNTSYQTSVGGLTGLEILLNNGAAVLKDDAADLWLSTYPTYTNPWTGTLTVYWGTSSDVCVGNPESSNSLAALEIVFLTGTKNNPSVTHYMVDPCNPRATLNKFEFISGGSGTVNGKQFAYSKTIVVASGLLMRVIPLYAPSVIGIRGDSALPSQGTVVTSTGTADQAQRKIVAFKGYPKLPREIFPYILFSPR